MKALLIVISVVLTIYVIGQGPTMATWDAPRISTHKIVISPQSLDGIHWSPVVLEEPPSWFGMAAEPITGELTRIYVPCNGTGCRVKSTQYLIN